MSARQKIIEIRKSNPEARAAEIARIIGVSRERVRQILQSLSMPTKLSRNNADPRARREYLCWWNMLDRCMNPKSKSYADYGARGISVCLAWQRSFAQFLKDMGPRPSNKHSIDRIENDGDYEPSNCRWATKSEQQRNKRPKPPIIHDGIIREIGRLLNMGFSVAETSRAVKVARPTVYKHWRREGDKWAQT